LIPFALLLVCKWGDNCPDAPPPAPPPMILRHLKKDITTELVAALLLETNCYFVLV